MPGIGLGLSAVFGSKAESLGPEIMLNGGFEAYTGTLDDAASDTFSGWVRDLGGGGSNVVEAVSTKYAGSAAVKISVASSYASVYQSRSVTPGKTYVYEFYARGDGANAGRYQIHDSTHSVDIVGATTTGVPGTTYTRVRVRFTVPAGCLAVLMILYSASAAGSVVYYDAVSLKEVLP